MLRAVKGKCHITYKDKNLNEYNQVKSTPGIQSWFYIGELTEVIHHINRLKDK